MDFLRLLEAEHRIQSADHVFEIVAQAGRLASRIEKRPSHSDRTSAALQTFLTKGREESDRNH
jgi:hypothetical protein